MAYICIRNQEILHVSNDKHERIAAFIAKIAQLVEHDLAKVGVAGSSPVFRSPRKKEHNACSFFFRMLEWWNGRHARLKILYPLGCAGSSPASSTGRRYKS